MNKIGLKNSVLWAAVLSAQLSFADKLWYSEDRSVTVLILDETDDSITFKQGKGTISFKKSVLYRIDHDTDAENDRIRNEWRRQYFDLADNVPPELQELAAKFRSLKKERGDALESEHQIDSCVRTRQVAMIRLASIQDRCLHWVEQLQKISPGVDRQVEECNRLAGEINSSTIELTALLKQRDSADRSRIDALLGDINRLRSQWKERTAESKDEVTERRELQQQVQGAYIEQGKLNDRAKQCAEDEARLTKQAHIYLQELSDFRRLLDEKSQLPLRQKYPLFFESLDEQFISMVAAIKTEKIEFDKDHGCIKVRAMLNGQEAVTLIFDTGATVTTLSRAVADRLGIMPVKIGTQLVTLANGSKVKTTPVILDSLSVGSASRENVAALVLEQAPGPGVDGLLGMSFLKHFIIKFGAEQGVVDLIHL